MPTKREVPKGAEGAKPRIKTQPIAEVEGIMRDPKRRVRAGSYYPKGHAGALPAEPPAVAPPAAPLGPAPEGAGGGKPQRSNRLKALGTRVGLGALGTLAGYAAYQAGTRAMGINTQQLIAKALADMQDRDRKDRLQQVAAQAREDSYRDSINMNLTRVQQYAPDLYAKVAAGRQLPQGAVVIGGAPRQDLLNELGRAMADGRFTQ